MRTYTYYFQRILRLHKNKTLLQHVIFFKQSDLDFNYNFLRIANFESLKNDDCVKFS